MAFVQYTDGTRELRSEAEAKKLWLIKVGRAIPITAAQRAYISKIRKTVKKVHLHYRTAPEEYIRANIKDLVPKIVADWVVDRHGNPTRPATKVDLDFAIKYGLWRGGKPTVLVTGKQKTVEQLTLV